MVKKIKGDLILKEDMSFDESIEVEGNIICENERKNLIVARNIDARDIDARDIVARNIDAGDIVARDIVARNIDAWNIVARDIDARDIVARNIDAWNIVARDIDAGDIVARDIDAWDIVFCENIKLEEKSEGKIKAKAVIRKRFELEQKEWKSD